jgi:hypothetical protein
MLWRSICSLLLVLLLAGCQAPYKKEDEADRQPLKDQAKDTSFQAFIGRLRIAVAKKDLQTLASMMTTDFGYRWDTPPPEDNVFAYWDQNNLWPELRSILQEKFVPNDLYMVAPSQVVTDPEYRGYRAGMRTIGGSWRFAYFVPYAEEQ